jgi:hypothetical protein
MKRTILHHHQGDDRTAEVFNTKLGFEVDLYENGGILCTREVHSHSEVYAENVAENWVLGVFDYVPSNI